METARTGASLVLFSWVYFELLLINLWSVMAVTGKPASEALAAASTTTSPLHLPSQHQQHPPLPPSHQQQHQPNQNNNIWPSPTGAFNKTIPGPILSNTTVVTNDGSPHKIIGFHTPFSTPNPGGFDLHGRPGDANRRSQAGGGINPTATTPPPGSGSRQGPVNMTADVNNISGSHTVPTHSGQHGDDLVTRHIAGNQTNQPKALLPPSDKTEKVSPTNSIHDGVITNKIPSQVLHLNHTLLSNSSSAEKGVISLERTSENDGENESESQTTSPEKESGFVSSHLTYSSEAEHSYSVPAQNSLQERTSIENKSDSYDVKSSEHARQELLTPLQDTEDEAYNEKDGVFAAQSHVPNQANETDVHFPAVLPWPVINNSSGVEGWREGEVAGSPAGRDGAGDEMTPGAKSLPSHASDKSHAVNTTMTSQPIARLPVSEDWSNGSYQIHQLGNHVSTQVTETVDELALKDGIALSGGATETVTILSTEEEVRVTTESAEYDEDEEEYDYDYQDGYDDDEMDEDGDEEDDDYDEDDYNDTEDEYDEDDDDKDNWYYGMDDDGEEDSEEMEGPQSNDNGYGYDDDYDYADTEEADDDEEDARQKENWSRHRFSKERQKSAGEIFLNAHGFAGDHVTEIKSTRIDAVMRRPIEAPRGRRTSMSLLVFYTWMAVVAFMAIVALVGFKNRHRLVGLFWEKKIGYRRTPRTVGIEEGHTLLSHQHV